MSAPFNPFQSGASSAPPGDRAGGGAVAAPAPLAVSKPPTPLLAAAGVTALVGLVTAGIGWQSWWSLLGWALAGPVAIGVMGAFIGADTRRRAEPVYLRPGWISGAYAAVATVSGIGIVIGAIGFALWMGRR